MVVSATIHGFRRREQPQRRSSCRLRDWSLITGRGGATEREGGGACEVFPLRKLGGGGGQKMF